MNVKRTRNQSGFALLTAVIFSLALSIGLIGMYQLTRAFTKTALMYDKAEYGNSLARSAAFMAGELVTQVLFNRAMPTGSPGVTDTNMLTNDLLPSGNAQWDDDVKPNANPALGPDLTLRHDGSYVSYVDIDYVPLTPGFNWGSIKFGNAYQEASAGNSVIGTQSFRIHVLTVGPNNRQSEIDSIFIP